MDAHLRNFALVVFAVLTQGAVGLVLAGSWLLPDGLGGRLAFPFVALGLLVSLAHLGAPAGAVRALANLRRSWLSREVLLTGVFALAAGVYGWAAPTPVAGAAAAVLGLGALFAQAMVYQLPTRPEWRHWANLLGPFAGAALVGALAGALVAGTDLAALRSLGALVLVASACVLLASASWAAHLARLGRGAVLGDTWFWVRLVAGVLLPSLAGLALCLGVAPDWLTTGGALAGAVAGELIGRSLFYRVGQDPTPATQF
jgi:DMSO reductase anchor subunit